MGGGPNTLWDTVIVMTRRSRRSACLGIIFPTPCTAKSMFDFVLQHEYHIYCRLVHIKDSGWCGGISRAAARAHCSQHAPVHRFACSPQFASILFVPIPPRFCLILSITQRVPILFLQ